MGEGATGELRKVLDRGQKKAIETRRRIEELLEKVTGLSPARLQALRAIEALEKTGSREARQVLEALAKGLAGARLTEEARAADVRLSAKRLTRGAE
jgi:hypothetical protein